MTDRSAMRLLLVDADSSAAARVRAQLSPPGSPVTLEVATDVSQAQAMLERSRFDVVLLAVASAEREGCGALERIASASPRTPIVVLAAQDDENLAAAALQCGAQDYFVKGRLDSGALLRALRFAIERQRCSGELRTQRSNALRANAFKDDLIAVLAHDFKGSLTTISGFAELLEQDALKGKDAAGALRAIRNAAARLTRLANDALDLSRAESGDLNLVDDPVDVANLVRASALARGAHRAIEVNVRAGEPVVRGDAERLRQVFENVIGNAVKYSPQGAPVIVDVDQDETNILVRVRDRGMGIPETERAMIFERFARASNAKRSGVEGTGVGLYLANMLVKRHGGTIRVEGAPGEGSIFTISLPCARTIPTEESSERSI